jgi:hypothetical protein
VNIIIIIIQLPHKTNNFLIIKATISFSIIVLHKITRHYHLRYKSELPLKYNLYMQLQKSQTTQSRIAEGLIKHTHTIILVRSNEMASENGAVYTSTHPTGTHITTPYTAMKKYYLFHSRQPQASTLLLCCVVYRTCHRGLLHDAHSSQYGQQ